MFYQNTPNTSRTQNSAACGCSSDREHTPNRGRTPGGDRTPCGDRTPSGNRTPGGMRGNSGMSGMTGIPCPPPGCTMSGERPNCKQEYECGARPGTIDQYPVAMAYVPWQTFGELFPLDQGFQVGTIFQNLDFPFTCASPACKSCIQPRNMRGGRV